MATTIITPEDLQLFKEELLGDIENLLNKSNEEEKGNEKTWLKSYQVQRRLGISVGTLQNLRVNGTIPYTKIGGVLFYDQDDIDRILIENKRNAE